MAKPTGFRAKKRDARFSASPSGNAAAWLGEVSPNMRVVGVNKGQFSMLDLITAVLDHVGAAEVVVSTWTPGVAEMDNVARMLNGGKITRFRLLVDRSFVTRHPEYIQRINSQFGQDTIRKTRTHMKVALIAAGDYRIVIRSSANFNTNPNIEQFDLDDDAAMCNQSLRINPRALSLTLLAECLVLRSRCLWGSSRDIGRDITQVIRRYACTPVESGY